MTSSDPLESISPFIVMFAVTTASSSVAWYSSFVSASYEGLVSYTGFSYTGSSILGMRISSGCSFSSSNAAAFAIAAFAAKLISSEAENLWAGASSYLDSLSSALAATWSRNEPSASSICGTSSSAASSSACSIPIDSSAAANTSSSLSSFKGLVSTAFSSPASSLTANDKSSFRS